VSGSGQPYGQAAGGSASCDTKRLCGQLAMTTVWMSSPKVKIFTVRPESLFMT
jgi:hypothetical protein